MKFVERVAQVTFSGARAAREERSVLYVTERCVFGLIENGLELLEVAPGIDIERDILRHLPFRPQVKEPRLMEGSIFRETRMGLEGLLSELSLDKRISYNPETNMLFLDFSGLRLHTSNDIAKVRDAVEAVLAPLERRVDAIVNYDGFWTNPDLADEYLEAVRYIQTRYYNKASRYATNGFARIRLAKGLLEHQVHSDIVATKAEAKRSLNSTP